MTQPFRVIGHRGAAGYEPENTLRSLNRALELGATWVEFDIQRVEETLVLFHDRSLKRRTGREGTIEECSLAELRTLDAGKGEKIPLLDEALDLLEGRGCANIELKGSDCAHNLVTTLKRRLGAWWSPETLILSSFDHPQLHIVRAALPHIPRAPILKGDPFDTLAIAQALEAYSVHVDMKFIHRSRVTELHTAGYQVYAYTVNKTSDLQRVRQAGVDGVFTDMPDAILNLVHQ